MPLAALAPIAVLAAIYLVWILRDIMASEVRLLPKWGWILVVVLSIPFGGLVYLLAGREPR